MKIAILGGAVLADAVEILQRQADGIAVAVAGGAGGIGGMRQKPLAHRLLGLHPQLHDAFADLAVIVVFGDVADFEEHQAGNLFSRG